MDKKQFDEWCAKSGTVEEGESTRDKALRLLKRIQTHRQEQMGLIGQVLRMLDSQLAITKSQNDLAHVRKNLGKLIAALEQNNGTEDPG